MECDIMLCGSFYLLFAAVDLPFLLRRQGEHSFPVLLCEVELILHSGGKKEKCSGRGKTNVMSSQSFADGWMDEIMFTA